MYFWNIYGHVNIISLFTNSQSCTSCIIKLKLKLLLSVHQMGSINNDILDEFSIVDKYVQITINILHSLKQVNT